MQPYSVVVQWNADWYFEDNAPKYNREAEKQILLEGICTESLYNPGEN